jgi:hypothetical protein
MAEDAPVLTVLIAGAVVLVAVMVARPRTQDTIAPSSTAHPKVVTPAAYNFADEIPGFSAQTYGALDSGGVGEVPLDVLNLVIQPLTDIIAITPAYLAKIQFNVEPLSFQLPSSCSGCAQDAGSGLLAGVNDLVQSFANMVGFTGNPIPARGTVGA